MEHPRFQLLQIVCLLMACSCSTSLFCQGGHDVKYWTKLLSVKRDAVSAKTRTLTEALMISDSSDRCSIIKKLEQSDLKKNKCFLIRLYCINAVMEAGLKPCVSRQAAREKLVRALQMAYELEDPWLMEEVHESLSRLDFSMQQNGLAIVHGLTALEMQDALGHENFSRSSALAYEIGFLLYHAKDYRTSITINHKAIEKKISFGLPGDTLQAFYKMSAWNTIGLAHTKLHEYDSAFMAFRNAYELTHLLPDDWSSDFWRGIIKGNRGDVYYHTGQLDSAEALLAFDYQHSLLNQQYDNAGNSLQWLARIHAAQGNWSIALKEIREADSLERRSPKADYRANILYTYVDVFRAMKNADSMDHYLKKYMVLHDSLEHAAFESKADIVRIRMDHQKSIHQIRALSKEKKNILMVRNFIIVIVLMLAAMGYLFFHRERLKLRLRQQEALQDKMQAEADAASSRDQLKVFTQHMLEKSDLVDSLKAQLFQKEYTHETATNESDLTQLQILTDEDWEKFRGLFENVYPGFFQSIKRKTEGITLAEQRMASLIKLKVPAKKAAIILGISPNSVHKTRQRLRHRLGLSTDSELDDYFTET